jgi:SAM-dependent methyltransferase
MPLPGKRPCPHCGSTDQRPQALHADHHVVRCAACGLTYTGIAPTPEELQTYYGGYPVHDQVSPITLKRYDEILERLERFRKTNRIIDVGCGAGIFLERAALKGWEVHGTEFGQHALNACRARGISIIEGTLDPANYPPGHFDVACSFEVIEHLPYPGPEMENMARLLRPGGALYVTTPNYRSVGHWLTGRDWTVVNYPEHLNYFTPRTLRKLITSKGFRAYRVRTTGISLNRIKARHGHDRSEKEAVRTSQEDLRARLEHNPLLNLMKRTVDALLDLFGIGDNLKATFIKGSQ